mmetsp:Transcript_52572/g.98623  ORF Transcript_52572/g.98623 Transcript_52572/m.98623 type:complete len:241 (-) Transcript_52572:2960-3682(-)
MRSICECPDCSKCSFLFTIITVTTDTTATAATSTSVSTSTSASATAFLASFGLVGLVAADCVVGLFLAAFATLTMILNRCPCCWLQARRSRRKPHQHQRQGHCLSYLFRAWTPPGRRLLVSSACLRRCLLRRQYRLQTPATDHYPQVQHYPEGLEGLLLGCPGRLRMSSQHYSQLWQSHCCQVPAEHLGCGFLRRQDWLQVPPEPKGLLGLLPRLHRYFHHHHPSGLAAAGLLARHQRRM